MHGRRHRARSESGQAAPIVAVALWLTAAIALLLAMMGARAVDRARAQSAADAVALAVAAGGEGEPVARSNGAVIERVDEHVAVDVVVQVGEAHAGARAAPIRPGLAGLHPDLRRGLALAEALLGEPVTIISGLRTRAEQEALWANRHANPYPVARPGTSRHERGLAVDVVIDQAGRLAQISDLTGVCQPLRLIDPVHFILCQETPTR